jgi:hypothetical protein
MDWDFINPSRYFLRFQNYFKMDNLNSMDSQNPKTNPKKPHFYFS